MTRRSHDEAESMRVRVPYDQLSDLPLALQTAVVAQPARVVEVRSHTRVVDGSKLVEDGRRTIDERYAAWKVENADLLALIRAEVLAEFANGDGWISVDDVCHGFRKSLKRKINSDFTSRIARDLVDATPALRDRIRLRELKAKVAA